MENEGSKISESFVVYFLPLSTFRWLLMLIIKKIIMSLFIIYRHFVIIHAATISALLGLEEKIGLT